ncbi:hypothetical protein [Photobacterium sp. GSS17]|uniref:hypothetical protein n=1 Tax=Photobacterium sp. GSS17 TaxID=3020715 RepID=UPI002362D040|nr:hypothetical protein [Photobacterium sp. GSS17]
MYKLLVSVLLLFSSTLVNSAVALRPHSKDIEVAHSNYGWMSEVKGNVLGVYIDNVTSSFISEAELQNYITLRLRNLARELSYTTGEPSPNKNWLTFEVELYKFNDTSQIYYGLISLNYAPARAYQKRGVPEYQITIAFAEGARSLKTSLKKDLDNILETFASDYYRIADYKPQKR